MAQYTEKYSIFYDEMSSEQARTTLPGVLTGMWAGWQTPEQDITELWMLV